MSPMVAVPSVEPHVELKELGVGSGLLDRLSPIEAKELLVNITRLLERREAKRPQH